MKRLKKGSDILRKTVDDDFNSCVFNTMEKVIGLSGRKERRSLYMSGDESFIWVEGKKEQILANLWQKNQEDVDLFWMNSVRVKVKTHLLF